MARRVLVDHGNRVAAKAGAAAAAVAHLNPDLDFIYQAALLHDIGMIFTDTPDLGCHGDQPYIRHGVLGRKLLEAYGYPLHALVCERHVGVGISVADIKGQDLALPCRDMRPRTIEEQIICYADKFFSKSAGRAAGKEKSPEEIIEKLAGYGSEKADQFRLWLALFKGA